MSNSILLIVLLKYVIYLIISISIKLINHSEKIINWNKLILSEIIIFIHLENLILNVIRSENEL